MKELGIIEKDLDDVVFDLDQASLEEETRWML